MISGLKRPKLLVAAARLALPDYRRDRVLRRVLMRDDVPRSGEALVTLIDMERMYDAKRRAHDAGYSPLRHLEVLIALMGEARRIAA